jgi:hypothetical protein
VVFSQKCFWKTVVAIISKCYNYNTYTITASELQEVAKPDLHKGGADNLLTGKKVKIWDNSICHRTQKTGPSLSPEVCELRHLWTSMRRVKMASVRQ